MGYIDTPCRLSPAQLDDLLALSAKVDLRPGPGGSKIAPLGALTDDCRRTLNAHEGWDAVRFVALYPSRQIVAHRDEPIAGVRLHLPIATNAGCWSFCAGAWQHLELGRCYGMQPSVEHGAVNWGSTVRIHLMIDVP